MSKSLCYGYIRWSSDAQSDGTTYERQLATATRVANQNGLELVKLIDDGSECL